MLFLFDPEIEELFKVLTFQLKEGEIAYLVGGAVRDIVWQQTNHDLDIALLGDVQSYGRRVADAIGATFFVLNDKFNTVRVILTLDDGSRMNLDIVKLRVNTIEEDLKLRDFTINAMAINLVERNRLIDPFDAIDDLQSRKIIACSQRSFTDDPIRILRALRQSIELNCIIEKNTVKRLKEAIPLLRSISNERIRDEFFRLLDGKNIPQALQALDHIKALEIIIPEVVDLKESSSERMKGENNWQSTLNGINQFAFLDEILLHKTGSAAANNLIGGQVLLALGKYRNDLASLFQTKLHIDRSLRSLFYYLLLFSHMGNRKDTGVRKADRSENVPKKFIHRSKILALSNHEIKYFTPVLQNLDAVHLLTKTQKTLTGSQVYAFFHKTGESGILLCLASLAESLAIGRHRDDFHQFEVELDIVQQLFLGYFQKKEEWVKPQQWLDGHEVGGLLKTEDKNQTGYWLEKLNSASANKQITSKQEAIDFIRTNYSAKSS
ncbi:MAG: hypothetical protein BGO78_04615 [Chloroflexi bacterium 44-23]|nr:MAG: hypothetical protein BGO78_04615 [Chloroflexi bacterium 44-23]